MMYFLGYLSYSSYPHKMLRCIYLGNYVIPETLAKGCTVFPGITT